MTNLQIITGECSVRNITEEVHTFARWKQMGYKVKKGQKALFHTSLWKKSNTKNRQILNDSDDKTSEQSSTGMYLCKSYLFGKSQVEEIKEKEAK